ncbi:MAG TPA: MarR family winged helix-turn-helix transcriptional regulator [Polyangiaceae bacterium]
MTDARIGDTLYRLFHTYRRALLEAHAHSKIALGVSQVRTLKSVGALPDCTAQAIVGRTLLDKAQITRALNDLERAGLIEKRSHPSDGRSSVITPTAAGKRMLRRLHELETQAGARMAAGLAPDELAQFVRLANRMLDNLQE